MLTLIFTILLFGVFGKLFVFGLKAAWSLSKLLVTVVFLPLMLLGLLLRGFVYLAIIGLIVAGITTLVKTIA